MQTRQQDPRMHRGRLFVLDDHIVYSPNSHRIITEVVQISPTKYASGTNAELFPAHAERPYAFDRELAWLPFVPLRTPFMEPFEIIGGPILAELCQDTGHQRRYEFSPPSRRVDWSVLEERLMRIIRLLVTTGRELDQKKQITIPVPPSSSNYLRCSSSRTLMYDEIAMARWKFTHLLACITYLLQTDAPPPPTTFTYVSAEIPSSRTGWRPFITALEIPNEWVQAMYASETLFVDGTLPRVGVFLDLKTTMRYGANIAFYVKYHVPVWYFWDSSALEAVRANPALLHFAPSPGEVRDVLKEPRLFSGPVDDFRRRLTRLRRPAYVNVRHDGEQDKQTIEEYNFVNLCDVAAVGERNPSGLSHQATARTDHGVRLALPGGLLDDLLQGGNAALNLTSSTPKLLQPPAETQHILFASPQAKTTDRTTPQDDLFRVMWLRYGYVRQELANRDPCGERSGKQQWMHALGDVGFAVYASQLDYIDSRLVEFVDKLNSADTSSGSLHDTHHSSTTQSLRDFVNSAILVLDKVRYEIRTTSPNSQRVILYSSADTMYACRLGLITSGEIALALLDVGIPFAIGFDDDKNIQTFHNFPSLCDASTSAIQDYVFTPADYNLYASRRREVLSRPRAQRVLLRGGITWRLAREVLGDMKLAVQLLMHGAARSTTDGITEEEWMDIFGFISVRRVEDSTTSQDGHMVSWWPTEEMWSKGKQNAGFWTADNEKWYQDRLSSICSGTAQPLSTSRWRSALRMGPKNGTKVRLQNEIIQANLLRDIIHTTGQPF